ncbi:hypothetical protein DPMN_118001 [Dreissena polymorpha]|uniref:Uncharacterized protein n=2 Tax=Dreissena polymorpha TaxID=45954 RepID=A0A9D4JLG7_DREPO|nr:hypothetical protein DPMN_118001 [Dreissena polymorpha]
MKMCSYFEGIRICTSQPVSDACHVDAGKYISSFIYGITPNSICENGAIYTVLKSRSSVYSYYGQTLFAEFLFICSFKLCFFE